MLARGISGFDTERLLLARYLAWALEFALAADIVDTAITPDWAKNRPSRGIAAIRTGLNLALRREIDAERRTGAATA